ncbi:hypothetical protein [Rhodophyticola sp.]|uniref:hypothetical protein n=1 Tax=Rhodophyticola sp. TaxID=2680032 RepID=UPI003D2B6BE0
MFRQWGAFLRRRFREVLICMVVGGVLGALLVTRMELLYEGKLLLMVEPPARSPLETEASAAAAIDAFVEGQVYIIQSTQVLSDVVARTGLDQSAVLSVRTKRLVGGLDRNGPCNLACAARRGCGAA